MRIASAHKSTAALNVAKILALTNDDLKRKIIMHHAKSTRNLLAADAAKIAERIQDTLDKKASIPKTTFQLYSSNSKKSATLVCLIILI